MGFDIRISTPIAAFVLSFILMLMTCVSAFAPQWHVVYPAIVTLGLSSSCYGSNCYSNSWAGRCHSESDYVNRFRTVEAFTWMGVAVCAILLAVVLTKIFFFPDVRNRAYSAVMITLSAVACIFFVIAAAVFGGTVGGWFGCGVSYCKAQSGTCMFSISFGILIVSIILTACSVPVLIVNMLRFVEERTRPMLITVAAFTTAAGGLGIAAALSRMWMMVFQPTRNYGIWNDCVGATCGAKQYTYFEGFCPRSASTIESRFKASGAFMIMCFAVTVCMTVYFALPLLRVVSLPTRPAFRLLLVLVVFIAVIFEMISVAIYGDTVNHYMTCGLGTFCHFMGAGGNTCTYGTAFGTALVSFGLFTMLIALLLLDACGCCHHTVLIKSPSPTPARVREPNHTQPAKKEPPTVSTVPQRASPLRPVDTSRSNNEPYKI